MAEKEEQNVDNLDDFKKAWDKKNAGAEEQEIGGVKWDDAEALAEQRKVIWDFAKTLGRNLFVSHDLTNIAMPVQIFEPESYLVRIGKQIKYHQKFLPQASKETDPVERFKLVITFIIAGLHLIGYQYRKPFNPILGETFHCCFEDGSEVYLEQSSHHPPISCWECIGKDELYTYAGWGEFKGKINANSLLASQEGPQNIYFPDGGYVTFSVPSILVTGMVWGERRMNFEGSFYVKDELNELEATIQLSPKVGGGMFSKKKTIVNGIAGEILKGANKEKKQKGKVLSKVDGNWLNEVKFDGKSYWKMEEEIADPEYATFNVLPSDARFREDVQWHSQKNVEKATEWKKKLEEKQRGDRALRKGGKEAHARMKERAKELAQKLKNG